MARAAVWTNVNMGVDSRERMLLKEIVRYKLETLGRRRVGVRACVSSDILRA